MLEVYSLASPAHKLCCGNRCADHPNGSISKWGARMLRRPNAKDGITQAARRPLKIFASDPLAGRTFGNRARIDVVNEELSPGPSGARLEVVDYDGAQRCFYSAVNLDHPAVLLQS